MSQIRPTSFRTTLAGALRDEDAGAEVRLAGWVHKMRDLGGLVFIDLRDRSGRVQLSFGPDWTSADVLERARRLSGEAVIAVQGSVVARPPKDRNTDMATGGVEVHVTALQLLSDSETPPIPIAVSPGDELPAEDLRLRYRYLDLRRDDLQRALETRHRALQLVRGHLTSEGFLEIETPMLTRRTPEGARDYLVPSRVHPGEFYALPQSPQIYKQLLMVSGYDRYFQIARCLRDEDLRADRQPEFTQIDAEMSFVGEDDVFGIGERMIAALWKEILGVDLEVPFPRMTHAESMARYGTDKPDLRLGMEFMDLTDLLRTTDFRLFQDTRESGARIKAFRAPGVGAKLSRKDLDQLADVAKSAGAAGSLWLRRTDEGYTGQFAKTLTGDVADAFTLQTQMQPGDLMVVVIGRFWPDIDEGAKAPTSDVALDALRRHVGEKLQLRDPSEHAWAWITDFPMFEWDYGAKRLVAAHHPFTMPHVDDIGALEQFVLSPPSEDLAYSLYRRNLRSRAYDAVYNGNEMASGSIRIHDQTLQRTVFAALGMTPGQAEEKFGFLLEAFRYGPPPHGGFAFGFDRLIMLLVGAGSLREVIAFPKTTAARALFEGAPAPVEDEELRELHIKTVR
jgi:aspartyl-tRNA synthetase